MLPPSFKVCQRAPFVYGGKVSRYYRDNPSDICSSIKHALTAHTTAAIALAAPRGAG